MVQGTASHVGKSMLAAAFCRIYARRGVRVAPFKAQNLALNSYLTPDGGELGRAQAYQARAAGLEPHVDMNPVLLKPNADIGSQVVLLGRTLGTMAGGEYFTRQAEIWSAVAAAFDRLRARYELLVVEGAGSPAEINLRGHDIVNMRLAAYAQCPVLLVGDIERGGVFASLYGTTMLLPEHERALIKGYLINKFHGDATQLTSGFDTLRQRTGIPTLGVIPYLVDWHGEEEDVLGLERHAPARSSAAITIAVIHLPHIANFTDFDALIAEDDVLVRYVQNLQELAGVDAIILPGTKSTIADLHWLVATGLAQSLRQAVLAGTPLIGICGGYQMLGHRILDAVGSESSCSEVAGLGLLDIETSFFHEKRTVRTAGCSTGAALVEAGIPVRGYEIHMGRTTCSHGVRPLLHLRDAGGEEYDDGACSADGLVCGAYLHGLFDHPQFRRAWINDLRAGKNLPELFPIPREASDIDRLADHVSAYVDMAAVDEIIGMS